MALHLEDELQIYEPLDVRLLIVVGVLKKGSTDLTSSEKEVFLVFLIILCRLFKAFD